MNASLLFLTSPTLACSHLYMYISECCLTLFFLGWYCNTGDECLTIVPDLSYPNLLTPVHVYFGVLSDIVLFWADPVIPVMNASLLFLTSPTLACSHLYMYISECCLTLFFLGWYCNTGDECLTIVPDLSYPYLLTPVHVYFGVLSDIVLFWAVAVIPVMNASLLFLTSPTLTCSHLYMYILECCLTLSFFGPIL